MPGRLISTILAGLLVSVGMVQPAQADGANVNVHRRITLHGRPLATAIGSPRLVGLRVFQEQESGQIRGIVRDAAGHPLANYAVVLWHTASAPPPARDARVAHTTTDAVGEFVFAGLAAGHYAVEVQRDGHTIAMRHSLAVSPGGMVFADLGPDQRRPVEAAVTQGRGGLFWAAVGAGIGGAVGLIAVADVDCSAPESLCPVAPAMGATLGAVMGFLFGVDR